MRATTHSALTEAGEPAEDAAGPDRRRVAVFGGLALAALAAVGALLLSAPDETVLEAAAAAPAPAAPASEPAPSVPVATPSATGRDDARPGRNPFVDPVAPAAVAPDPAGVETAPAAPDVQAAPPDGQAAPPGEVLPGLPTAPGDALPTVPGTTDEEHVTSLALLRVTGTGDARTALLRIGRAQVTARVGDSFGGPAGLLLLSLQEGPAPGRWTAVVQVGQGEPFDVTTGATVALP